MAMSSMSADEKIKVNGTFKTWTEFQHHFRKWCDALNAEFSVLSSKTVGWANRKLLNDGERPYHEDLKYKYLTYGCKHGTPRRTESKGMRPIQRSLKLNCPAQVVIVADQGQPQLLRITKLSVRHENHPQTKEHVQHLPERRRLDEAEKEEALTMLIEGRGKSMSVKDYMRKKTGKSVTCRDLSNLRQAHKRKMLDGKTPVEDVIAELENLTKTDPGSTYVIGYKEIQECEDEPNKEQSGATVEREIAYIFFQTSAMKRSDEKFPEVLGMDTTHKVNKHNMDLVVFQVTDNHGCGRTAAYCLIARETKDILEAALTQFKNNNPEGAGKIRTVLVDKDYKEIGGIRKVLNKDVKIHLCHVHVHRVFKKEIASRKEKNGKQMRKILLQLSNSASKTEFHELYNSLKEISSADFLEYFDKNWRDIDEAWVLYVRNCSLTLGIRSTNSVESHNGKIKDLCEKCMSLGDCIRSLLLLQRNSEYEVSYRDFREISTRTYVANSDDPVLGQILKQFAYWPARLLFSEWNSCKGLPKEDIEPGLPQSYDSCSCNFFKKFDMKHCQHIFWKRKCDGLPILDIQNVRARWLKPSLDSTYETGNEQSSKTASGSAVPFAPKQTKYDRSKLTGRYNEVMGACKELASLVSATGGKQYESWLFALSELTRIFLSGKKAVVLEEECASDNVASSVPVVSNEECETSHNCAEEEEFCCHKCKQQLQRQVTKSDRHGNNGRWHMACPKRCTFRWCVCPYCETRNVRVGHHCDSMPEGETPFDEEHQGSSNPNAEENANEVSSQLDMHENADDCTAPDPCAVECVPIGEDSANNSKSKQSPSEHESISFDLGIEDILNASFTSEMDGDLEQLAGSVVVDQLISKSGSLAAKQTLPTDEETPTDVQERVTLTLKSSLIERYTRGLVIPDSHVERSSPGKWLLRSQDKTKQRSALRYTVTRRTAVCANTQCEKEVSPCRHKYICDCPDLSNPCKHIYKVNALEVPEEVVDVDVIVNGSKVKCQGKTQAAAGSTLTDKIIKSLVLPPAPKISGRPHVQKTRTWKGVKKTPGQNLNLQTAQRTCDMCQTHGPPTSDMAHKCAECGDPVHSFGCSTARIGGNEGHGGSDRVCWSCFEKASDTISVLPLSPIRTTILSVASRPAISGDILDSMLEEHEEGYAEHLLEDANFDGHQTQECFQSELAEHIPTTLLHIMKRKADFQSQPARKVLGGPQKCGRDASEHDTEEKDVNSERTEEMPPTSDANPDSDSCPWEKHMVFPYELNEYQNHSWTCKGLTLATFDFNCLREKCDLSDTVIDAFGEILIDEAKMLSADIFTLPSLALTNITLGVDSYLTSLACSPILCNDMWVVPSNVNGNHWVIFIVLVRRKLIIILDSLYRKECISKEVKEHLQILRYFINSSHEHCVQYPVDWASWKVHHPTDFPRQQSSNDCGIYVCLWIYSVITGTKLLEKHFKSRLLLNARNWICCTLWNQCDESSMKPSLTPASRDMGPQFYTEAREAVEDGTIVVKTPWRDIPEPSVNFGRLQRSTTDYLKNVISSLFVATDKNCGAPLGCKLRGMNEMYLCELCRDWFHLKCVRDTRPPPCNDVAYICMKHQLGATRSRIVRKPLRHRLSID